MGESLDQLLAGQAGVRGQVERTHAELSSLSQERQQLMAMEHEVCCSRWPGLLPRAVPASSLGTCSQRPCLQREHRHCWPTAAGVPARCKFGAGVAGLPPTPLVPLLQVEQLREDNEQLRYTADYLDGERRENARLLSEAQAVQQLAARNEQLRLMAARLPGLRAAQQELAAAECKVHELAAAAAQLQMASGDLQRLQQEHRQLALQAQQVVPVAGPAPGPCGALRGCITARCLTAFLPA
jgi:hypothetical protein